MGMEMRKGRNVLLGDFLCRKRVATDDALLEYMSNFQVDKIIGGCLVTKRFLLHRLRLLNTTTSYATQIITKIDTSLH